MKTTEQEKEIQLWEKLLKSFTALKDSLVRLGDNWPSDEELEKRREAEKKRQPEHPLAGIF